MAEYTSIKLKTLLLTFCLAALSVDSWADALSGTDDESVLFYESFDQTLGKGGNDGLWNGSGVAAKTLITDNEWGKGLVNYSGACQCALIGYGTDAKERGSATTPFLHISGNAILTFKAAAYDVSKPASPIISISASNGTVSISSITLGKKAWKTYTIIISEVKDSTNVTIAGTNCYFFLDEVMVQKEQHFTIGSREWGTFYTDKAFVMPEDAKGVTVTANDNGTLTLATKYEAGDVVPASTPLLINAPENEYTYLITSESGTEPGTSFLRGQLNAGMITKEGDGDYYYYKLTTGSNASTENYGKLGFYWGAENGAVFEMKNGNRAYLVLPKASSDGAKEIILDFDGTTDGIGDIFDDDTSHRLYDTLRYNTEQSSYDSETSDNGIYNILGQRVIRPVRGRLYIRNGKKYICR